MLDTFPGFFVTGTGTSVGKTFVARGLARAAVEAQLRVAALKPVETGCAPNPADALALAHAAARPELAHAPGFYRAAPPLSPWAVSRLGASPPPSLTSLAQALRAAAAQADFVLVEGAGGLLVPLDARSTFADLAAALGLPLLLVAPDRLGVLSDVLCYAEVAAARSLPLTAVVLNRIAADTLDPSVELNEQILAERLGCPVVTFPPCANDDHALAHAARRIGLTSLPSLPERLRSSSDSDPFGAMT